MDFIRINAESGFMGPDSKRILLNLEHVVGIMKNRDGTYRIELSNQDSIICNASEAARIFDAIGMKL